MIAAWRDLPPAPWAGGLAWAHEIRRLGRFMQCRSTHHRRFLDTCAQLTPWRLRSPVQCNQAAIEAVLPLLENARAHRGRIHGLHCTYSPDTGWTRAQLGELLVIARNRAALYQLGRDRPKPKGPRFDLQLLPDDRLASLIQRHPDLAVVDALRGERQRRIQIAKGEL